MTSVELFRNDAPKACPQPDPPEWGTGKLQEKPKTNLWAPKSATWIYTGEPTEQHYTLTQLKLSNVRLNDQLLPRPQDCDMGKMMINKPFPAEHPYASHMSRFSVFPKFDTPEDAKRGFAARGNLPKEAEMPSQPYDCTIVRKVKGNAFRHEQQALPPESMKQALHWHDGDKFDQIVKSPSGGQQPYYPTPTKIFNPNLDPRDNRKLFNPNNGDMQIAPDTANATRNVEREQWQTTYDLNHTGLGPGNVKALDNAADKEQRKRLIGHGKDEDDIHPREIRTFDPPRPMEGRIARALVPNPGPQTDRWPNPESDPNYKRKMTLTEKEEDILWNGQEYRNLPTHNESLQWRTIDHQNHPLSGLKTIEQALATASNPDAVPFVPTGEPPAPCTEGTYLDGLLREHQEKNQQIEAQNRWQQLESQTPSHNIGARQRKVDMHVDKSQPETFYRHEGKYNRERAGLYKTSYDPYSLQHSMNKDQEAGGELFYTMDSHNDALNNPVGINNELGYLMREGRTLGNPGSVPQLHAQPAPHEAFDSYGKLRNIQTAYLQPSFQAADVKTQENGTTLVESTYGDGYNTMKFLQENNLPPEVRKEPILLMSNQNQSLKKSKMAATLKTGRSVQFSGNVTVASGAGGETMRLSSAPIKSAGGLQPAVSSGVPVRTTRSACDTMVSRVPAANASPAMTTNVYNSLPVSLQQNGLAFAAEHPGLFTSKSTTVSPGTQRPWNANSSYSDLFPGNDHVDMTFKNDSRFGWKAGSGKQRQQSTLIRIQDSFSKSEARRKFHERFPEKNPDLRENMIAGKKHVFVGGLNAQVLRGTPLVS